MTIEAVVCPHCKERQAGLIMDNGKPFTLVDEMCGTRVLSYKCHACGRPVHYPERQMDKNLTSNRRAKVRVRGV